MGEQTLGLQKKMYKVDIFHPDTTYKDQYRKHPFVFPKRHQQKFQSSFRIILPEEEDKGEPDKVNIAIEGPIIGFKKTEGVPRKIIPKYPVPNFYVLSEKSEEVKEVVTRAKEQKKNIMLCLGKHKKTLGINLIELDCKNKQYLLENTYTSEYKDKFKYDVKREKPNFTEEDVQRERNLSMGKTTSYLHESLKPALYKWQHIKTRRMPEKKITYESLKKGDRNHQLIDKNIIDMLLEGRNGDCQILYNTTPKSEAERRLRLVYPKERKDITRDLRSWYDAQKVSLSKLAYN